MKCNATKLLVLVDKAAPAAGKLIVGVVERHHGLVLVVAKGPPFCTAEKGVLDRVEERKGQIGPEQGPNGNADKAKDVSPRRTLPDLQPRGDGCVVVEESGQEGHCKAERADRIEPHANSPVLYRWILHRRAERVVRSDQADGRAENKRVRHIVQLQNDHHHNARSNAVLKPAKRLPFLTQLGLVKAKATGCQRKVKDRSDQRESNDQVEHVDRRRKLVAFPLRRRGQVKGLTDRVGRRRVLVKDTVEEVENGLVVVLSGAGVGAVVEKATVLQPVLHLW